VAEEEEGAQEEQEEAPRRVPPPPKPSSPLWWLPAALGVLLLQSAGAVERAYATGDEGQLVLSLSKIKTYFTITGVLFLLGLIAAVFFIFLFGMAGVMLGDMSDYSGF
jgi:hypothetical protein